MNITKKRTGQVGTLFANSVDSQAFSNLEISRTEIKDLIENLERSFLKLKESIIQSRTLTAVYNGRVDPDSIKLAGKVIDRAEDDLLNMIDDIKILKKTLHEIELIQDKFRNCRTIETKAISVDKYLSTGSTHPVETVNIQENLKALNSESRLLFHSVQALIQLKAGN